MCDCNSVLKSMRICLAVDRDSNCLSECFGCDYINHDNHVLDMVRDAADAIEELLRIGAKMHTWIFLNTADEQAAYDEIGLTDEQNALFGYSGQMILKAEPLKEEHPDDET